MRPFLLLLVAAAALGACASDPASSGAAPAAVADADGPLVIYSGRKDVLVGPLVERFERETGIDVEVKYGTDAALLATMAEEGSASPADVFWANTEGALVAAGPRLAGLPDSLTSRPAAFAADSGRWVPVTTRFRVLAVAPSRVDTASLPASVMGLPATAALRGRIGWTPTYSSFQDFVSAMRATEGEAETAAWLDGMKALQPKAYESNAPMLEALEAGEIDVALTNHYYVLRMLEGGEEAEVETAEEEAAEQAAEDAAEARGEAPDGPDVAMHHFAAGDVGNLALVTGAGVLQTSRHTTAALRFLAFLLSPESQAFTAREVHEYPVVRGTPLPDYLMPLDRAVALGPDLDASALSSLDATLALLRGRDLL
ncbi:MAG TPA: extracellular solute-binding protein [Rubricoccaceae bacterium]|jgi:iron(III) transport system substrate-binding protein